MKPKMIFKLIVDIIMTLIMLLLMAYVFIGNRTHMWLGIAEFIFYIMHNILNHKWYAGLFSGKYDCTRTVQTMINIAVFASMVGLMVSGIILSNAFGLIRINSGRYFARQLHMLSSYWGFTFMSLHVGLHWKMLMGLMRKHIKPLTKIQTIIARTAALIMALFGIYAFIDNDILSYMLLTREFAGFDMTKRLAGFICEYIAMMGTCIFVSHYGAILLRKTKKSDMRECG